MIRFTSGLRAIRLKSIHIRSYTSSPRHFADGSEMIEPASHNTEINYTPLPSTHLPLTNLAEQISELISKDITRSQSRISVEELDDVAKREAMAPKMDEMQTSDTDMNLRLLIQEGFTLVQAEAIQHLVKEAIQTGYVFINLFSHLSALQTSRLPKYQSKNR
jgi:hypothetical protein